MLGFKNKLWLQFEEKVKDSVNLHEQFSEAIEALIGTINAQLDQGDSNCKLQIDEDERSETCHVNYCKRDRSNPILKSFTFRKEQDTGCISMDGKTYSNLEDIMSDLNDKLVQMLHTNDKDIILKTEKSLTPRDDGGFIRGGGRNFTLEGVR